MRRNCRDKFRCPDFFLKLLYKIGREWVVVWGASWCGKWSCDFCFLDDAFFRKKTEFQKEGKPLTHSVFSPIWRNACRFEAPWSFRALPAIGVSAGPRDRHHRVERRRLALEPLGRRAPRSCGREPAGGRRRRERPPAPSPMWRRARARARPARVCGRAQACLRACARWWVVGSWENAWQCLGRAWCGT